MREDACQMETDANIFKSFKHFSVIKYVVQCITLFLFFLNIYYLRSFFSAIKRAFFTLGIESISCDLDVCRLYCH